MKTKGKITLWSILSGIMLVLAIGCIVGTFVAERYVSIINSFFNLDNYKIVGKTDPDTATKYYKSAFLDENGEPISTKDASFEKEDITAEEQEMFNEQMRNQMMLLYEMEKDEIEVQEEQNRIIERMEESE